MPVTDADRDAAEALRAVLADICGFWHRPGDDSPLCQALAHHREEAEARLAAKLTPLTWPRPAPSQGRDAAARAAADVGPALAKIELGLAPKRLARSGSRPT